MRMRSGYFLRLRFRAQTSLSFFGGTPLYVCTGACSGFGASLGLQARVCMLQRLRFGLLAQRGLRFSFAFGGGAHQCFLRGTHVALRPRAGSGLCCMLGLEPPLSALPEFRFCSVTIVGCARLCIFCRRACQCCFLCLALYSRSRGSRLRCLRFRSMAFACGSLCQTFGVMPRLRFLRRLRISICARARCYARGAVGLDSRPGLTLECRVGCDTLLSRLLCRLLGGLPRPCRFVRFLFSA